MFRKPPPHTPIVYVYLHKDEWTDEILALWVKDCPVWWCRVLAERLVELKTVKGIRLEQDRDLRYRYGYIREFCTLTLHHLSTSISEDMLKWLVEHEFSKLQGAQVEWVTSSKLLNLKRKKD